MSKSVNKNAVDIYFKNLREYIDDNRIDGGVEFLKEIKTELLYLLLKNGQSGGGKLSKIFIQHCNDSINYCNLLESKILLSESVNRVSDPTYEQMVDYIKSVFGDDVDEFDLNGGIYYFASHYHHGQTSNLYRAISQSGYKPGAMSKEPVSFTDYEYTYLLYNIKYDIDDYEKYENDELPDSMRFVVKKSQVVQDGGGMDRDDLEALMTEYISEVTGYIVDSYEFRLISSSVVEGDNDVMNAVYRALINKFASVSFDVGGKHDELPPGEHHELPPGIKEQNTNMNEKTISILEVKDLINEVIAETLQQEVGSIDYDDYEPIASKDDFAGEWLSDTQNELEYCINRVKKDNDPDGKYADKMLKLAAKVEDYIENPNVSQKEKDVINKDSKWDELLGFVHDYRMSGGGSEKMYVAEGDLTECGSWNEAIKHPMFKEAVLTEKAPPGMEKWIKANKAKFIKKYGDKKGMSVLYATAWKMFYNKKGK